MKTRNLILILLAAAVCGTGLSASTINTATVIRTTPEDSIIYTRTMEKLLPLASLPPGELMVKAAEAFCGTPYAGGTLETEPEVLTVNMRETDCILLVEACTAMTLLLKDDCGLNNNPGGGIPPFEDFCAMIRTLRYRHGKVDGYASRLHYTSEWLLQARDNGLLREVTEELGGKPLAQTFSFMSSHGDSYPQLKNDAEALGLIRETERRLDTATAYFQIPAGDISSMEDSIQDGDIICFVSTTHGLDITHVGIARRTPDGALHFIHASSRDGKVVLEPRTLTAYCRTGIRIVRLNDIGKSE